MYLKTMWWSPNEYECLYQRESKPTLQSQSVFAQTCLLFRVRMFNFLRQFSLRCLYSLICVTALVVLTTLMNVAIFHSILGTVYSFSSCSTFTEVDVPSSYTQKPTAAPPYMPFEYGTYMLKMFIGDLFYCYS